MVAFRYARKSLIWSGRVGVFSKTLSHPELALPTFESFGGEAPEAENAAQQELELTGIELEVDPTNNGDKGGEERNGNGDGALRKMAMGSFGIQDDFLSFSKQDADEAYAFSDTALQQRQQQPETSNLLLNLDRMAALSEDFDEDGI
jgi:hypothetical protein